MKMGLISQAFEECKSCQNNSVNAWNGKPDPKAINKTDVTYNDGEGVKDTVVIDGPLSHAFTQALNIHLKKKPLQPTEEVPTPEASQEEAIEEKDEMLKQNKVAKIGIAAESQQQTETTDSILIRELDDNSEEFLFLANKFDFVEPDELPINIVCKTTIVAMNDFLKPSNIIGLTDDKTRSSIDHVVVVVGDSLGRTNNTTSRSFIAVESYDKNFESSTQEKDFKAVVENHVKPAGYKVFLGMEQYANYLKNLSKELFN